MLNVRGIPICLPDRNEDKSDQQRIDGARLQTVQFGELKILERHDPAEIHAQKRCPQRDCPNVGLRTSDTKKQRDYRDRRHNENRECCQLVFANTAHHDVEHTSSTTSPEMPTMHTPA